VRASKMPALIAMCLHFGCGGHVTPCGSVVNLRPEWEADIDWAESLTLVAFALYVKDERLSSVGLACKALSGVHVVEVDIPPRQLPDGGVTGIAGYAQCWMVPRRIELQARHAEGVPMHHTAYAHEAAHIAQDCAPRGPATDVADSTSAESHAGWVRDGIYTAIEQVYKGVPW